MAIDFSLSELVALAVESFFYGALPPLLPHYPPTVLKTSFFFFYVCRYLLCALLHLHQGAPQQAQNDLRCCYPPLARWCSRGSHYMGQYLMMKSSRAAR